MMKAYDWMKPARGIFDFQKDWGVLRGVRNIFKKVCFWAKICMKNAFFTERLQCMFGSPTWFCNYLSLFYIHLQQKRRKSLSYCEKNTNI